MASSQMLLSSVNPVRPLAHFTPSLYGNIFTSSANHDQFKDKYSEEIQLLEQEVSAMLVAVTKGELGEKLKLIDTIERLGLSYHFSDQIEQQLDILFRTEEESDDLFTEALRFRILRQHGYGISPDVFKKFKDDETSKFSGSLTKDPLGMLSLYEATFLRGHGEEVLDEALAFTTCHLQAMKQISHSFSQSLHRGVPRLEARFYISVYEEDPMKNDKLLRFAKLDFHLLMMIHQQELCELTRWWDDLELASKLPYVRDRMVENYFWAVSIFFEPCYSVGRITFTKMVTILVITDDTYDAYATFDELGVYTDAVERFDRSCMDQLPDYMQICYKTMLDTFEEFEEDMSKKGMLYTVNYLKESFKVTVRSYYLEAKWLNQKHVAPFEEYLANAKLSTGLYMISFATFMGLKKEDATVEACNWAKSYPKIVQALCSVGRLNNDMRDYEDEKKREHVATSILCYTKEHGGTKDEACAELYRRIENAWKDANEALLKPSPVSVEVLMRPLNMMRMIDVTYKYDDGYTNPHALKEAVEAMFVEPMPI
ncbi:hypothetical protein DCAR_0205419 [Daucus carota subsp. sativus]|uniref:Uncharacterized protein n=1 Tax=Daucus carota subsp. sativus TaxID=79200 RepID=A0AAF1AKP9_DAUCS|nr:hypothetical protein DCAR_0205419 [Daucus carota subsp. sativus]